MISNKTGILCEKGLFAIFKPYRDHRRKSDNRVDLRHRFYNYFCKTYYKKYTYQESINMLNSIKKRKKKVILKFILKI